jgi:hypothetical protein
LATAGPPSALPDAETLLELSPSELNADLASLEPRAPSQKLPVAPAPSRPQTRAPLDTALEEGALVAAAQAIEWPEQDRTPATRTAVPVERPLPAPARETPAPLPSTTATAPSGGSRVVVAAGLVSVAAVVTGLVIATSKPPSPTATMAATATPPAVVTSPPRPAPDDPVTPPAAATVVVPPTPTAPATPTTTTPPTTPTTTAPTTTAPTTTAPTITPPKSAAPTSSTETPARSTTPPSPLAGPASSASVVPAPQEPSAEVRESAKPGTVYVDVVGSWAFVSIGKKSFGDTPVTLTLPPGRYVVTLTSGDGATKKNVPLTVTPGARLQIRETL